MTATPKTPIYSDRRALEVILRWCDRGGEEPEGQCLHEIEHIARNRLAAPTMDEFHVLSQEIRRQVEANHELRKAMLQAEQALHTGLSDQLAWSVSIEEAITILARATEGGSGCVCEHGIPDGDWCEPCNKAYKEAAADPANEHT